MPDQQSWREAPLEALLRMIDWHMRGQQTGYDAAGEPQLLQAAAPKNALARLMTALNQLRGTGPMEEPLRGLVGRANMRSVPQGNPNIRWPDAPIPADEMRGIMQMRDPGRWPVGPDAGWVHPKLHPRTLASPDEFLPPRTDLGVRYIPASSHPQRPMMDRGDAYERLREMLQNWAQNAMNLQ